MPDTHLAFGDDTLLSDSFYASLGPRSAEASLSADRVSDSPGSEPAQIHTRPVTNALLLRDGDADFATKRRQLAVDAAFLADGFASLEALVAFEDELHAAYIEALSTHQPAAVWERLLVDHRFVKALGDFLEARA